MRFKFTKRSREHKIGKAHATYVMRSMPTIGVRPNGEPEFTWVGTDTTGRELEIVAVDTTDRKGRPVLLVIHVMPTALRRN